MKRLSGFTVIELLVAIVFLALATTFLVIQRGDLMATHRDSTRKTSINAFYYSLEEVYYASHHAYPDSINSSVLPSVEPALFTDTNGKKPGDTGYEYHYDPTGCANGQCKAYTLSVHLEKEAEYTKHSRHS